LAARSWAVLTHTSCHRVVPGSTRRTRAYEALHGSVIGRIISRAGLIEVHLDQAFQPPKALADRA